MIKIIIKLYYLYSFFFIINLTIKKIITNILFTIITYTKANPPVWIASTVDEWLEHMFQSVKSQIRSAGSQQDFFSRKVSSLWCKPAINY